MILTFIIAEYSIGWIFKFMYFITHAGNEYELPNILDFHSKMNDVNTFIIVFCTSPLISCNIAGRIGGKIAPNNNVKFVLLVFGIIIPIIYSIIVYWNSKHWFYSIVWIIDMLLAGTIYVISACESNSACGSNKELN